jgi:hypothetical protein
MQFSPHAPDAVGMSALVKNGNVGLLDHFRFTLKSGRYYAWARGPKSAQERTHASRAEASGSDVRSER